MLRTTGCTNEADYSKVSGERILPFVFVLDTEKSILNPTTGQYQTFCYTVTGVGHDISGISSDTSDTGHETSGTADLEHFLLGICEGITREDIVSVTVTIDGMPQEVVWGKNIEIRTAEEPDPETGCIGLEFDFPLKRDGGKMEVCFSLSVPFAVGPATVCAFGDDVTASSLSICGPVCNEIHSCESTFFQRETVCVPVTVTPFANPGDAKATCCGKPIVTSQGSCSGTRRSCTFTVTQTLCIEIPLSFGAVIETGAATVQCGDVNEEGCDCDEI